MVFIKSLKNGFGDWSSIQFSRIHSPRFIYKTYNNSTNTCVVVFHSTKARVSSKHPVKSCLPKLHCDYWFRGKCGLLSGDQLKHKKSTKDVWLGLFKMAHIKVPETDLTSVTINQLVPIYMYTINLSNAWSSRVLLFLNQSVDAGGYLNI